MTKPLTASPSPNIYFHRSFLFPLLVSLRTLSKVFLYNPRNSRDTGRVETSCGHYNEHCYAFLLIGSTSSRLAVQPSLCWSAVASRRPLITQALTRSCLRDAQSAVEELLSKAVGDSYFHSH